ncbi:MAG: FG-GAP repeat domain-containing protein, partial [Blastocatellia bacterium]
MRKLRAVIPVLACLFLAPAAGKQAIAQGRAGDVESAFAEAMRLHQAGDLEGAIRGYQRREYGKEPERIFPSVPLFPSFPYSLLTPPLLWRIESKGSEIVKYFFLVAIIITLFIVGAAGIVGPAFISRAQQSAAPAKPPVTFEEVSAGASKISWVHDNGRSEMRHLPETCGGGGLFFDYNNDGWLDIYFVNSGPSDFYAPKTPIRNALYRNNGDGTFADVTDKAGVACGQMGHFGMGAAAADFDGDGWQDLYVANYGKNVMFRNNGDGTFADITDKAGVGAPNWSTCATFFDYDNDGKLDLWVSSFVQYSASGNIFCGDNRLGRRYYCVPRVFKPRSSFLFHNDGGGKFRDVSKESGVAAALGKAFGAVATDINNDGLLDLFVANDTMANFLFLNKGKGKFEEIGLPSGVGYSDSGSPRSGMGVDAADYDGDGWQDLFVTNIDQELFSLYHNQKDLSFIDKPGEIAQATRLLSGWGLKFFDYDNDGDPDLILANGHP